MTVCRSRSVAAFIWDELAPSGWDQSLLLRRCKCKRRSLRITYRSKRGDPDRISVKHIVGLDPDGDYLPMLWDTFRHSSPQKHWIDFKYQRGRSPWGLNKRVVPGEDTTRAAAAKRTNTQPRSQKQKEKNAHPESSLCLYWLGDRGLGRAAHAHDNPAFSVYSRFPGVVFRRRAGDVVGRRLEPPSSGLRKLRCRYPNRLSGRQYSPHALCCRCRGADGCEYSGVCCDHEHDRRRIDSLLCSLRGKSRA